MSIKNSPSRQALHLSLVNPKVCAEILGQLIRSVRLRDGRPLEQIAPLAALTVPEWEGIEAGRAPGSWEHICLITAVLYLGRSWMPYLAQLWVGARRDDDPYIRLRLGQ